MKYKNKYLTLKRRDKYMTGGRKNNKIRHLIIVRHGETEWNKIGLSQGSENDIELNENGREQAEKT